MDIDKIKKVKRRRRKKGEVATRSKAIRNHCLECAGWNERVVRECPAKKCWLWPFRMGSISRSGIEEELEDDDDNS